MDGYSATTTATVNDAVTREITEKNSIAAINPASPFAA